MRYIIYINIIFVIITLSPLHADELVLRNMPIGYEGTLYYSFDKSKISEETIRKLVVFHPKIRMLKYRMPAYLIECNSIDPNYYPCGRRDINSKYFYKNALVNIKKSKDVLKYYDDIPEIKELSTIVNDSKKNLIFGIWLREREYNYYKTWDIKHLKIEYMGVDPERIAPKILKDLQSAKTKEEKYYLVKMGWEKIVYKEFLKKHNLIFKPEYQERLMNEWRSFLKAYDIKEKIVYREP